MAKAAGKDPLEFRRSMMKNHPKHLGVLNAVPRRSAGASRQRGRGARPCQMMGFGSYVAGAAEVTISDKGKLKIERLVMATDCGYVVNPQQVTAQVEGSVAYGSARFCIRPSPSATVASSRRTSTPIRWC